MSNRTARVGELAPPRHVDLLGMPMADLNAVDAAAWIAARPAGAPFGYVVTPNADHFVRLSRLPSLRPLYDRAMLRLLDSRVVGRAGRLLRIPVPRVAPGSDVTERLLVGHVKPGERVTIVGLDPQHLPALLERVGLSDPAHYNPPMGFARDPEALAAAVEFVIENPARFIFLAVGSPQQELLADAIRRSGRATGTGLCVGASLVFLAGVEKRAPQWMQRLGIEWLFRLMTNPKRLARRYLVDSPQVFRLMLKSRFTHGHLVHDPAE